jgi:hypothetical protein
VRICSTLSLVKLEAVSLYKGDLIACPSSRGPAARRAPAADGAGAVNFSLYFGNILGYTN